MSVNEEDKAILEALGVLEVDPSSADLQRREGGGDPALRREYMELLGLLSEELEPVEPSSEVKERLLQALRTGAEVVPFVAGTQAGATLPPASRWPQIAAAALVVLSLGLAGASGWLFSSLQDQRARVDALQADLERRAQSDLSFEEFRREFDELRLHFELITQSGLEICSLEPTGQEPMQPAARGRLFMSRTDDRWLLTANDLEPCSEGRAYHVWFRTDDGVVSGGFFHVARGETIELSAAEMPEGTRAVLITLESSETVTEPSGPTILYGEEPHLRL